MDGDGTERDVDVIIYGTGFHVTDAFDSLEIIGRGGRTLRDVWAQDGMATHLGLTVTDFPNMFFLLGPNTGLGHNSVVFMIECQTRYVAPGDRHGPQRWGWAGSTSARRSSSGPTPPSSDASTRASGPAAGAPAGTSTPPGSTARSGRASPSGTGGRPGGSTPTDFEFFGRAADAAATPTPEEASTGRAVTVPA